MTTHLTFTRRSLLKSAGGAGVLLASSGCPSITREAYAPWDYPGTETRPPWLAVRAALLAANPHNTQPWRFEVSPEEVKLFADMDRNLGTMDGLHREMRIGLGCALENMVRAAQAAGRHATVELLPDATQPQYVARVALTVAPRAADPLADAIARRHTHRGGYTSQPLADEQLNQMQSLVDGPEVELHLLTQPTDQQRFKDATVRATQAIVDDQEMSADSHRWYRHTAWDIHNHRDGITLDASGLQDPMLTLSKMAPPPTVGMEGSFWLDATKGRQQTGAVFGILSSTHRDAAAQQLAVGRAWQRLHLFATSQGLAMQPLNQMAERQDREQASGSAPDFTSVLASFVGPERGAQMLFRAGHPKDPVRPAPRRPVEWVAA